VSTHPGLDLVTFIQAAFQRSVNTINQAAEGLSDEDLFYQPTKDTNSIAWLAWHLSRRKDYYAAKLVKEKEVWITDGWHQRFNLPAEDTGLGNTPEQVTAFKPDRELLFSYIDAAQEAAAERLMDVTPELLDREVELDAGRGRRPASTIFNPMTSDCLQHLGQIAYLRGIITGRGWMAV
jgi:hypothetical protein